MGILDNLEGGWDENFQFESKPMQVTDNMGRPTEEHYVDSDQQKLTPGQAQAILIFQIEQKLRNRIALQVESKFHDMYHEESHVIGNFIRNMA
jgi:hypothetical protein